MRRGFSMVSLIIVIVLLLALVSSCTVVAARLRAKARQLQDATHLRGMGQALFLFAKYDDDTSYLLPSKIDVNDATVPELGRSKDTTANIFSILIQNGYLTSEICISPLERSKDVIVYEDYQTERPEAAVDPANAIWDPGFSADFSSGAQGNISYAHLIPVGERLKMWATTSRGDEALMSSRGPEIAKVERSGESVTAWFVDPKSVTTKIHRSTRKGWSGNVCHNDNMVRFQSNLYAHGSAVGSTSQHQPLVDTKSHDVLFADEAGFEVNHFLGIFTTAGEAKEDYTAIWD